MTSLFTPVETELAEMVASTAPGFMCCERLNTEGER